MRNQNIWSYTAMYGMSKLYMARPIANKHDVFVKGLLRRFPDRIDLVAYIKLKDNEYLAIRSTYKGKIYGPYRVPDYSEFHGERGFYEIHDGNVELPLELVTAIKSRFAEYIEWRITQYNHGKNPDLKEIEEDAMMKAKPNGYQFNIEDGVVFSD